MFKGTMQAQKLSGNWTNPAWHIIMPCRMPGLSSFRAASARGTYRPLLFLNSSISRYFSRLLFGHATDRIVFSTLSRNRTCKVIRGSSHSIVLQTAEPDVDLRLISRLYNNFGLAHNSPARSAFHRSRLNDRTHGYKRPHAVCKVRLLHAVARARLMRYGGTIACAFGI